MSWVNLIWLLTAGICLAFAAVQPLVWDKSRRSWGNLLFAITSLAAADAAEGQQ